MRIVVSTKVEQNFISVYRGFDRKLFLALKPPLMPMRLLRFDGCKRGDEVHVRLGFGQEWISLITDFNQTSQQIYFIDEGVKLPAFLKYWKHKHRMVKEDSGTLIIDDITYQSPYKWLDWVLYPFLKWSFTYRKPIYQRFFKKHRSTPLQTNKAEKPIV